MRFAITTLVLTAGLLPSARAHFFFLVPEAGQTRTLGLILGDGPTPDPSVAKEYGQPGEFWAVSRAGTVSPANVMANDAGVRVQLGGDEAVEVYGSVTAGVVLRGQAEPVLIVHHPRAALEVGGRSSPGGKQPALSVRPTGAGGEVAFAVAANGKPHPHADVTVYVPGEPRPRAVKTGTSGVTPSFTTPGRYAARVSWLEPTAGEYQGRRYAAIRHYATVVVEVGSARGQ
jgi:hypothetical protein